MSEGEKGIGVTKAYATYVADNKKAGIGTLVFGDCLKVNGVNIYEKKERPGDYFISLPSRKGEKDGQEKYYDYVYPLSTKLKGEIDVKLIQSLEESRKKSEEKGQNEDISQGEQEKEMQKMEEEQQKRKGR
ncbi:MAG: septation protein SpoVG family protein [Lachnospiraceae bacterium]|nr:septation protein SpoVG family protein [Lachnospiraceae bacterium]